MINIYMHIYTYRKCKYLGTRIRRQTQWPLAMTVSNTSSRCQNSFTRKTCPVVVVVVSPKRRAVCKGIIISYQRVPPDSKGMFNVYVFCIQSEHTGLGLWRVREKNWYFLLQIFFIFIRDNLRVSDYSA